MPSEPSTVLEAPPAAAVSAEPWVVSCGAPEPSTSCRVLARGRAQTLALQGRGGSRYTSTAVRGALAVVVEGFLNEAAALTTALARSGIRASTPAEIVLHTYSPSDSRFLQRTRGVNARVIGDIDRGTLLAARDPLGNQPLFYAFLPGGVAVSPSIDALLAQPGVDRALNRAALADHLAGRWPDATETYHEAVRRIPPGHLLTWTASGGASLTRYWNPYPADQPIPWVQESEADFDGTLEQAVTRCLVGRTGIFLSGGFDSVSIAAVAADVSRTAGLPPPHAMSIGFPHGEADEQVIQRRVSSGLKLPLDLMPFGEALADGPLLTQATEMCRNSPAPLLHTWSPVYAALASRGRTRGVDVVLTGGGGDEWLGISPRLAADFLLAGDFAALRRFLVMWRRSYPFTWLGLMKSGVWRFGIKPVGSHLLNSVAPGWWNARRIDRLIAATPAWVAPDSALRRTLDARAAASLPSASPAGGFYAADIRTCVEHALVSTELEESYVFGQRLGVRFLRPYFDVDLVELLWRTRPDVLTRGGRAKGLVRQTVAKRFPDLGFAEHKKRSATSFYRSILLRELPSMWTARGGVRNLARLGIADAAAADVLMAGASQRGLDARLYKLWDLFNLDTWVGSRQ